MLRGTVAHNCHGKTKNLAAKTKYLTAKPKTSRQNHKPNGKNKIPHDKTKYFTAKTKYLTAKPKTSRQKQKPHGKTKNLTAKPKTSRQNQILHSKNQIPHGKSKYPRQNQSYFVFAVRFQVLPWQLWATVEGSMSRGNISWIVLLLLPASVSAPQFPDTKPPPTLQTVNNNYGLCNILR